MIKVLSLLLVLVLLGSGAYIYFGTYDVGADVPHYEAVHWLTDKLREKSIESHAKSIAVPALDDPGMILTGAGQYAAMCSTCHLAPGFDDNETRTGLYPKPPKLSERSDRTPAETFWTVKHGIKMSGMPAWGQTHDDKELWAITAFVMRLPTLDAKQYREIVAKAPPDHDMKQMPMPGGKSPE